MLEHVCSSVHSLQVPYSISTPPLWGDANLSASLGLHLIPHSRRWHSWSYLMGLNCLPRLLLSLGAPPWNLTLQEIKWLVILDMEHDDRFRSCLTAWSLPLSLVSFHLLRVNSIHLSRQNQSLSAEASSPCLALLFTQMTLEVLQWLSSLWPIRSVMKWGHL